ncbi:MAG: iron-sulfur cluster repair di-iron protein [Sphingobacteriales bacterium]|nr:iron-sulfur cluster repair di-iron protein [Sphingobacteriales bacterium]
MNITDENKIGELVALNYRTASVFKKHKIDFCCKGNRSIKEVCDDKKIDMNALMHELKNAVKQDDSGSVDFNSWDLDLLADYIEKKHHRYVEEHIPMLQQYLHKLCRVHGDRHPELLEINEHFNQCSGALTAHMKKEELVLFPYIRKMVKSKQTHDNLATPHFGTVENPVRMMMHEHDVEGERFRTIARLSNQYTPPDDACNTYRVTYNLLQEFENDLHLHIHLENNILFPKAVELESFLNVPVQ